MPARTRTTATSDRRRHAIANGYRSGLEERVAAQLAAAQVEATYEAHSIHFTPPVKRRRYTPDFVLPNGIIIETKGRFLTADRQKHKDIQAEHPGLDIRFVFSRAAARLSKTSKTTYADWCERYGFLWAEGSIPETWLREDRNTHRLMALQKALTK